MCLCASVCYCNRRIRRWLDSNARAPPRRVHIQYHIIMPMVINIIMCTMNIIRLGQCARVGVCRHRELLPPESACPGRVVLGHFFSCFSTKIYERLFFVKKQYCATRPSTTNTRKYTHAKRLESLNYFCELFVLTRIIYDCYTPLKS